MITTNLTRRILIVDDDRAMRDTLMRTLSDCGYEVTTAWTAEDALNALASGHEIHAVISDNHLPGMDGRTLVDLMLARYPHIKPILMMASYDGVDSMDMENAGPVDVLVEPVNMADVLRILEESVGRPPEMPSDYWVN